MSGIQLVKDTCKAPDYKINSELCLKFIKEVLKIGKYTLRSIPLVKLLLVSMAGKTEDQILKALEITNEKFNSISEDKLHPKYFITVLKNQVDHKNRKSIINTDNTILQWGRSI